MFRSKLTCALLLAVSSIPCAFAASPVGTWKGKIIAKMPPLPANAPPQRKAMMQQIQQHLAKTQITLSIKANHTFQINATGMSAGSSGTTGKWTQKGSAVTLVSNKPGSRPQTMNLEASGKKMVLTSPGGSVVFTR